MLLAYHNDNDPKVKTKYLNRVRSLIQMRYCCLRKLEASALHLQTFQANLHNPLDDPTTTEPCPATSAGEVERPLQQVLEEELEPQDFVVRIALEVFRVLAKALHDERAAAVYEGVEVQVR